MDSNVKGAKKMPWNKNDPFFVYGLVDPSEWDWRSFGESIAKACWNDPKAYIDIDIGKLLGLIRWLDRLEAKDGE